MQGLKNTEMIDKKLMYNETNTYNTIHSISYYSIITFEKVTKNRYDPNFLFRSENKNNL